MPLPCAFQIEKASHCDFLFVYGGDDQLCGIHHAEQITNRLSEHGCTNYKLNIYPGAGHLLEPPYTPLSATTYHKVFSEFTHYTTVLIHSALSFQCKTALSVRWKTALSNVHFL